MTCHIVDRKANNLSRTSGFAITVAVVVYNFLCVCALSDPFAVCALFAPSVSTSVSASVSTSAMPGSSTPSASSVARLLSVHHLLHLCLLCLC